MAGPGRGHRSEGRPAGPGPVPQGAADSPGYHRSVTAGAEAVALALERPVRESLPEYGRRESPFQSWALPPSLKVWPEWPLMGVTRRPSDPGKLLRSCQLGYGRKGIQLVESCTARGQGSEVELAGYLQVSGQHEPLLVWKTCMELPWSRADLHTCTQTLRQTSGEEAANIGAVDDAGEELETCSQPDVEVARQSFCERSPSAISNHGSSIMRVEMIRAYCCIEADKGGSVNEQRGPKSEEEVVYSSMLINPAGAERKLNLVSPVSEIVCGLQEINFVHKEKEFLTRFFEKSDDKDECFPCTSMYTYMSCSCEQVC
ncbi:hypothetical protein GUITHDRAFT_142569 [Guillardia theta CCMP2712]|uniref:Uncharacterized protein n=1 Tax=Guillardia theta (strain CCMP2712) TaxID=905079 RepID=L1IWQ0_GUITC|nr:hypothetical protein GUITHDRAFT_142569 [Guillardia theta CCMP2712]EKX40698.1 hypothetical protein GUITHDRAFT_142569 [Guillardia theta CCMP2712]|eukprot:XP_005827678.1 hypothetical protein GUITHDRAFT_142569 [Guillardia theta CCMP2712]